MRTDAMRMQRIATRFVIGLCVVLLTILTHTMDSSGQEVQRPHSVQPPAQAPTEAKTPVVLIEPTEDYRISPGDVIEVQIDRAPELSITYRVTANGTILMRYLGRIVVQQKTQEELAASIADALRGRYLKNPHVSVEVKQINSHVFFIQGAVHSPGVYQMEGRPSLLKLITIAGGLADNHGSTAFIMRETRRKGDLLNQEAVPGRSGDPTQAGLPVVGKSVSGARPPGASQIDEEEGYELIQININGLFKGQFDQDMFVEPRDIVNIPATDVFFVAGEVQAPGSYSLKDGTTLRQAISLAQGTTFKAASSRGVVFRVDPATGKRQVIKVDISAVMSGRKEDLGIMANDIVIVPHSRFKSVGAALLTALGTNAMRLPRY